LKWEYEHVEVAIGGMNNVDLPNQLVVCLASHGIAYSGVEWEVEAVVGG
jgi:hypothetical protein